MLSLQMEITNTKSLPFGWFFNQAINGGGSFSKFSLSISKALAVYETGRMNCYGNIGSDRKDFLPCDASMICSNGNLQQVLIF